MKHSFLFYLGLISTLIMSESNQCNGLSRKLSETPLAQICRKTSDFGLCVYTLRTDPRSSSADPNVLAHIALDKLGGQARATTNYLHGLQRDAAVVGPCIQLYGAATNKDVPAAMASLNGRAYGAAKQAAGSALRDGQGCQQRVDQNPSFKWQMLTAMNKMTHDYAQLSGDLIGLLG